MTTSESFLSAARRSVSRLFLLRCGMDVEDGGCMYVPQKIRENIFGQLSCEIWAFWGHISCQIREFCKFFLHNSLGKNVFPQLTELHTPMRRGACRRQRRRGRTGATPHLSCRGSSMCWTFPRSITPRPMQSRVRCTIFVDIIACVVGTVVEQVYSSCTFKFCSLLKKYKN